mmetsp:Transcript_14060/g.32419  ORF Transcript_14060/g.32419 Transcript_14060/m.32419 type:complete len:412 (+) Transcript_14060:1990-3225(+)
MVVVIVVFIFMVMDMIIHVFVVVFSAVVMVLIIIVVVIVSIIVVIIAAARRIIFAKLALVPSRSTFAGASVDRIHFALSSLCAKQIKIVVATNGGRNMFTELASEKVVVVIRSLCAIAVVLRSNFAAGRLHAGCDTRPPIKAHVIALVATHFGRCFAQGSTKTGRTLTNHVFIGFRKDPNETFTTILAIEITFRYFFCVVFTMISAVCVVTKTLSRRKFGKVGIAFASIDAKTIIAVASAVGASSFKVRFAVFSNEPAGLRAVAKELFVLILVLESGNAFASVVAFVAILVGASFKFFVAREARPTHGAIAVHTVLMVCGSDNADASGKIGVAKDTGSAIGTIQVADSLFGTNRNRCHIYAESEQYEEASKRRVHMDRLHRFVVFNFVRVLWKRKQGIVCALCCDRSKKIY